MRKLFLLLASISFASGLLANIVGRSYSLGAIESSISLVSGWPNYLAMGAIGGPNIESTAIYSGDDGFGGRPVDAVFKYAGVNGNGDPGVIDPPMNGIRMTADLTNVSRANNHPTRVVMVEYTGQMSGGENLSDFTNTANPDASQQGATYIMGRHFATLGADVIALANNPVVYNGQKYYGSLIMNPDLLGATQQNGYLSKINELLTENAVNTAVDQAICLLTNVRSYVNNDPSSIVDWSGHVPRSDSYGKTYTGTPNSILEQMLIDKFPAWIISSASDQFWGTGINNIIQGTSSYSQVGHWFNDCITQPTYDHGKYHRPNFAPGFDGWIQANNWIIRTFSSGTQVTFGWQENMWAVSSGYWLHRDLTDSQISEQYSSKIVTWLNENAPSVLNVKSNQSYLSPDYLVFDRYEMDDSAAPGQATLYNARAWDNFVVAVGQVSRSSGNKPIMLWQIPGSHIQNTSESTPELYNNVAGSYVFSTATVYFFGDSKLEAGLGNIIMGENTSDPNIGVGSYVMSILDPTSQVDGYHCLSGTCSNYKNYLLYYAGKANNFDWSKDNGRLAFAAHNNIFAILWGGGNTTNVIKNFSNTDDHGYLADKIIDYYKHPQYFSNFGGSYSK